MPHTLGIKLENIPLSDDDAKVVSLLVAGLSYKEVESVIFIKVPILHNKISALYNLLEINKCVQGLIKVALLNGFDHYFHVRGKDVLCAEEHRRLALYVPRLLREKRRLEVMCRV